jgi:hypothetical protein
MDTKFFIGTSQATLLDDGQETELPVYLHELQPFTEGNAHEGEVIPIKAENKALGAKVVTEVDTSSEILCEYLGVLTNLQRPNVHIGEQVGVISLDNDSKYYWFFIGRDYQTRKTEIVRMYVCNKEDHDDKPTQDNAYVAEIDTRVGQKRVFVRTNQNMGEPFGYEMEINTVAGTMYFKDTNGNELHLNSAAQRWFWKNGATESIELIPGNINVKTVNLNVAATASVNVTTKTTNVTSPSGINTTASAITQAGNLDVSGAGRIKGKLPHGDVGPHAC